MLFAARADEAIAPPTIDVPEGVYIFGSDRAEREIGYLLDEAAYGHQITRQQRWYESEFPRASRSLPTYAISQHPITNAQYAVFVRETGHRPPNVDAATWTGYGLIHPFSRTRKFAWKADNPPAGRENHPVVLVNREDANAYARWLSDKTGVRWELPSEAQWEKAARGVDGRRYPWGNAYDATALNSHDRGPFDTTPVGQFAHGASPFGLLDAAGQVFEWTSTSTKPGRSVVKGGSWDDKGCGVCRPAARHTRPDHLKHILIGFRVVRSAP